MSAVWVPTALTRLSVLDCSCGGPSGISLSLRPSSMSASHTSATTSSSSTSLAGLVSLVWNVLNGRLGRLSLRRLSDLICQDWCRDPPELCSATRGSQAPLPHMKSLLPTVEEEEGALGLWLTYLITAIGVQTPLLGHCTVWTYASCGKAHCTHCPPMQVATLLHGCRCPTTASAWELQGPSLASLLLLSSSKSASSSQSSWRCASWVSLWCSRSTG